MPHYQPYCKTTESVWCNTNPEDLSVCSSYFIADRRMDVRTQVPMAWDVISVISIAM